MPGEHAQAAVHGAGTGRAGAARALMVSTSMTSVSTTAGQLCPVSQGGTAGLRRAALACAHCDGSRLLSRRLPDRPASCDEPTSLFASELQPELLLVSRASPNQCQHRSQAHPLHITTCVFCHYATLVLCNLRAHAALRQATGLERIWRGATNLPDRWCCSIQDCRRCSRAPPSPEAPPPWRWCPPWPPWPDLAASSASSCERRRADSSTRSRGLVRSSSAEAAGKLGMLRLWRIARRLRPAPALCIPLFHPCTASRGPVQRTPGRSLQRAMQGWHAVLGSHVCNDGLRT